MLEQETIWNKGSVKKSTRNGLIGGVLLFALSLIVSTGWDAHIINFIMGFMLVFMFNTFRDLLYRSPFFARAFSLTMVLSVILQIVPAYYSRLEEMEMVWKIIFPIIMVLMLWLALHVFRIHSGNKQENQEDEEV